MKSRCVLEKAGRIASLVASVFRRYGLVLNFAPGKSEMLLAFVGAGAAAMRHHVFNELQGQIPCTDGERAFSIFVVDASKRLGAFVSARATMCREMHYRAQGCASARKDLAPVWKASGTGRDTKLKLGRSLCTSRLFFNAGTWPRIAAKVFQPVSTEYMRLLRSISRQHPWLVRYPAKPLNDEELLRWLGQPSASALVSFRRLRFMNRLFGLVSSESDGLFVSLFAVLQECDRLQVGWPQAVRADLFLVRTTLEDKLCSLPDPRQHLGPWLHLIRGSPAEWMQLLKLFLSRSTSVARSTEASAQDVGTPAAPSPPSLAVIFQCSECDFFCDTAAGLGTHRMKEHGYRHEVRSLVGSSSVCRVCMVQFWTRPRLLRHLRERKAARCTPCLDLLRTFAQPIDPEHVKELDAEEAAACQRSRRQGSQRPLVLGPPVPAYGPRRNFPGHTLPKPIHAVEGTCVAW